MRTARTVSSWIAALAIAGCSSSPDDTRIEDKTDDRPNVLFVIMDDVGVDQMASFGYGGADAPAMPSIDTIAANGVRFRNTWSMPECSPGRSALMTGRYPMRNNIYQAIGPNDLANSQIDPWEITASKLLATAGYTSAMFGKFMVWQAMSPRAPVPKSHQPRQEKGAYVPCRGKFGPAWKGRCGAGPIHRSQSRSFGTGLLSLGRSMFCGQIGRLVQT